jgi:hypothetical protein
VKSDLEAKKKKRQKLPDLRRGRVHTLKFGVSSIHITVNRDQRGAVREMFAKAEDGLQSELEGYCLLASIAMQYGCPATVIAQKMEFRKHGNAGARQGSRCRCRMRLRGFSRKTWVWTRCCR